MAREPELSIKVKVDPQIKPTELKTSIERKVKQSGEKPQIDIDPNVDGIKKKVEDKLKKHQGNCKYNACCRYRKT